MKAEQRAAGLTEMGPRMAMQLIKIQEGIGDGNVLYHNLVHKSEEELRATGHRRAETEANRSRTSSGRATGNGVWRVCSVGRPQVWTREMETVMERSLGGPCV